MLVKALNSTIEYCLFTLGFITAVQLPEFIQQYKQYIAGKLSESAWHLDSYQKIADRTYQGDLTMLISDYLKSDKLAIQQTGQFVSQLKARYEELNQLLLDLNSSSYITQVLEFFKQVNITDAKTVMSYYQLAIPLTIEAIASGVILAFLLVLIKVAIVSLFNRTFPTTASRRTI